MKFTAREDVEASIDSAFRAVSDFDGFQRAALRRGAEVDRTDDLALPGAGMSWTATFLFRKKPRQANLELTHYDMPNRLTVIAHSAEMKMVLDIDLVALSRRRTRMQVVTDVSARSISARMVMQAMRLARSKLQVRYRKRISDFAHRIERRGF